MSITVKPKISTNTFDKNLFNTKEIQQLIPSHILDDVNNSNDDEDHEEDNKIKFIHSFIRSDKEYNTILKHYTANKDKNWHEWLEFISLFSSIGKQGWVGLFKIKGTSLKVVFKTSQYINHLVDHEYTILSGLKDISYTPHFCRPIGVISCNVEPKFKKKKYQDKKNKNDNNNPFEITSKYPIEQKVMLCEYISDSIKFSDMMKDEDIDDDVIFSSIKQILISVFIAQKFKKFSHYDLHSYNIMMKKCNKDDVLLYIIDKDNKYCIPTNGYTPTIIDYGFSYINDMEDGPLWASLSHTDAGFMSNMFDFLSDYKLFLVTISYEMEKYRGNKCTKKFRRIVKNMFFSLNIDWECGWDEENSSSAEKSVSKILQECESGSILFEKYGGYCIDLLQTLVILPLEKQNYEDIQQIYNTWIKEWVKIENEISSSHYNLFILKQIVDIARLVRPYYQRASTRDKALLLFKRSVYNSLNKVSQFCKPKDLHFEKMLCSLLVLSRNIEGILYKNITEKMECKQEEEYNKLPINTSDQIYGIIEANIPEEYIFNEKTKIHIVDCINKKNSVVELPLELIEDINHIHSMATGSFLYDKIIEK